MDIWHRRIRMLDIISTKSNEWHHVGLCHLESDIGGSDTRLSPIIVHHKYWIECRVWLTRRSFQEERENKRSVHDTSAWPSPSPGLWLRPYTVTPLRTRQRQQMYSVTRYPPTSTKSRRRHCVSGSFVRAVLRAQWPYAEWHIPKLVARGQLQKYFSLIWITSFLKKTPNYHWFV
jgi:hypothetical protein